MRGRLACFQRLAARSTSSLVARASAATCTQGNCAAHRIHSLEIAFGGNREAGFQNVDAQIHQLCAPSAAFPAVVMLQPGDCSPSRRVVSKDIYAAHSSSGWSFGPATTVNRRPFTILRKREPIMQIYSVAIWY